MLHEAKVGLTAFADFPVAHWRKVGHPDVSLPKGTWQSVEASQHRLVLAGAHRALSCVDPLLCAVAAQRELVILHDDNDFTTAARHLTEVRERCVQQLP